MKDFDKHSHEISLEELTSSENEPANQEPAFDMDENDTESMDSDRSDDESSDSESDDDESSDNDESDGEDETVIPKTVREFFEELREGDQFYDVLTEYVVRGETTLQQNRTVESLELDDTWINAIYESLASIEKIMKDPIKSIIDFYNLVAVERAKKTDSVTVRHLAQHTNFIRKIDDDGKINPSKLLSREMDEDLLIYENRFIVTLINNLLYFITGRYNAIKENIDTYHTTNLKMHSNFKLKKGNVDFDMAIRVRNETQNRVVLQKNQAILGKLEEIRKRVNILMGSRYYKIIEKAKPVIPPIMKTNIISMHIDYKNAYKLWIFISSYNTVGYSVDVASKTLPVSTDYYEDLTMLVALSLKTMFHNNAIRRLSYRKQPFKRMAKRKFREIRKIEYDQYAKDVAHFDDGGAINQFYFDKLKEMVIEKENLRVGDIRNVVTMKTSFQTFFRSINNMTNALYDEVLGMSKYKEPTAKQTSLQRKYKDYLKQEELFKKYQLLSQLKLKEMQQTLYRENTQKIKLARMKFDYEFAFEKSNAKKKQKVRRIRALSGSEEFSVDPQKILKLYQNAQKDEAQRMEKEYARQEAIKEKERIKLERLEKAREEQRKIREIAKEILREREAATAELQADSGGTENTNPSDGE